jgi:hypothetical protein
LLAARRESVDTRRTVPIYRLHDTTGDDLGLLEHPAPNLEPGDVVVVADGREAIVTARVEAEPGWGQLVALLEVAIADSARSRRRTPIASARLRIEEREAPQASRLFSWRVGKAGA